MPTDLFFDFTDQIFQSICHLSSMMYIYIYISIIPDLISDLLGERQQFHPDSTSSGWCKHLNLNGESGHTRVSHISARRFFTIKIYTYKQAVWKRRVLNFWASMCQLCNFLGRVYI